MNNKRSLGVMVMGIFLLCIGIVPLIFLLKLINRLYMQVETTSADIVPLGVACILLFILLQAGMGILHTREWARRSVVYGARVGILALLFGFKLFIRYPWYALGFVGAIFIVINYFFTRPGIKEQFK